MEDKVIDVQVWGDHSRWLVDLDGKDYVYFEYQKERHLVDAAEPVTDKHLIKRAAAAVNEYLGKLGQ